MLDRRLFLVSVMVLTAARSGTPLFDRAVAGAGGAAALRRARVLMWRGTATILAADRRIDIGVSTRVVPFVSARSDTWLESEGPTKMRSLIIERDAAWIERDGKRVTMPEAMARHERMQYALYGLLRLVSLSDRGASATPGPTPDTILARHPAAPDTLLGFDRDGRLAWATNVVPSAEDGEPIAQRFTFSGEIGDHGVRWPARIEIAQGGKPFFDLRLTSFAVEER